MLSGVWPWLPQVPIAFCAFLKYRPGPLSLAAQFTEKCATGLSPEPLKIGVRAVRWPESEIEAWLAARPRGYR